MACTVPYNIFKRISIELVIETNRKLCEWELNQIMKFVSKPSPSLHVNTWLFMCAWKCDWTWMCVMCFSSVAWCCWSVSERECFQDQECNKPKSLYYWVDQTEHPYSTPVITANCCSCTYLCVFVCVRHLFFCLYFHSVKENWTVHLTAYCLFEFCTCRDVSVNYANFISKHKQEHRYVKVMLKNDKIFLSVLS